MSLPHNLGQPMQRDGRRHAVAEAVSEIVGTDVVHLGTGGIRGNKVAQRHCLSTLDPLLTFARCALYLPFGRCGAVALPDHATTRLTRTSIMQWATMLDSRFRFQAYMPVRIAPNIRATNMPAIPCR